MKKSLKRILSSMLAATMLVGGVSYADIEFEPINGIAPQNAYAAGVNITESQGWLETAWVEWDMVDGASSYQVFYKASGKSEYTKIDDMLIRKYPGGLWRADILGLPAGNYDIKVSALNDSGAEIGSAESSVSVSAQDRSGFAFKGETTPGAYKADGSLKDGAQVIYLTKDNFATKQVTLKGKNGDTVTATGFDEILKQLAYAYNVPTAIRIIGRIPSSAYDGLAMSEDCVQMKGLESGSNKSDYTCEVTIEGVGEDASLGGGTCFFKPAYCEMRNLAVGGFGDDGVSMKSATYMWIHNLDLMYGNAGSDADQAKGDGSIDLKDDSQYVTISYVHFWDSGKCSLCGMKSEKGPNYITYHHNWFDHSDSRHPRIRTMSVHIYNNFFDGNAKYGVGAAANSSAFVENNVFENCKHPMLSSMQGSDIAADGTGTFSKEDGGIIKAYNNQISGQQSGEPVYYQQDNVEFDAYLASSRDEVVPTSVKAKQGGTTYDNESLAPSNLNATPEPVETVKDTVTKYAGRVNGGDFEWTFTAADNTNYDVDQELKSHVLDYVDTTPYVSVGPNEDGEYTEPSTSTPEPPTETTTKDTEEGEGEETTKPEEEEPTETTTVDLAGYASMGTYVIGKSASGGDFNVKSTDENYGNIDFSNVRGLENTGAKLRAGNTIVFSLKSETTIAITCGEGKDVILAGGSVRETCDGNGTSTFTVPAGVYTIEGSDAGSNSLITKIVLSSEGGAEEPDVSETTTQATTESTTEATTTSATTTTSEPATEEPSQPTEYKTITSDMSLNRNNVEGNEYFNVTGYNEGQTSAIQIASGEEIIFTVADGANVSVTARHSSSNDKNDRTLSMSNGTTVTYKQGEAAKTNVLGSNLPAGTYTISVSDPINITSLDITFTSEPEPSVVKGDANGDGRVTTADVREILSFVVGLIDKVADEDAADVNADNKVSSSDAYLIQRFINTNKW